MSGTERRIKPSSTSILAACGLNCGVCYAYLRSRNACTGCRAGVEGKPAYCVECVIRTCEELAGPGLTFCHACSRLPCKRLKDLDRRYRTRYGVSLMDNQARICAIGARAFLDEDRARWTCTACGAQLCMHSPACPQCGIERVMPATGVQAPGLQSRRSARPRRGSSGRR